jgi:hypothetical protein
MPGWFSSRVFLSSEIDLKRTLQRIEYHKTVVVSCRALVYSEKNVLILMFSYSDKQEYFSPKNN